MMRKMISQALLFFVTTVVYSYPKPGRGVLRFVEYTLFFSSHERKHYYYVFFPQQRSRRSITRSLDPIATTTSIPVSTPPHRAEYFAGDLAGNRGLQWMVSGCGIIAGDWYYETRPGHDDSATISQAGAR